LFFIPIVIGYPTILILASPHNSLSPGPSIHFPVIAPACSADPAKAISELISRGCEGIYHFSQEGTVPNGDFINRALEHLVHHGRIDKKYTNTGVEKEDFLAPCERPVYNVPDNGKLAKVAGVGVRCRESALDDYIPTIGSSILLT
jgi:dTDP-4-dehydrorhamnose reductase